MKKSLVVFCLLFSTSCGKEEPLPPCRYTLEGWVCTDAGNHTEDLGETPEKDMGMKVVDATKDLNGEADLNENDSGSDMPQTTAKSCKEIKSKGLASGEYEIEVGGSKQKVYCDSDVDGGGWMLLARSVSGATGSFGWKQKTGNLTDEGKAYSFGTPPNFKEMLVSNYSSGKKPGDIQYILSVPTDFLSNCADKGCKLTTQSPTGTCPDEMGKDLFMFDYAGHINAHTDRFFFRDLMDDVDTGLLAGGWNLFWEGAESCKGGNLHTKQGLIFIR